jgi:hypothetical protein
MSRARDIATWARVGAAAFVITFFAVSWVQSLSAKRRTAAAAAQVRASRRSARQCDPPPEVGIQQGIALLPEEVVRRMPFASRNEMASFANVHQEALHRAYFALTDTIKSEYRRAKGCFAGTKPTSNLTVLVEWKAVASRNQIRLSDGKLLPSGHTSDASVHAAELCLAPMLARGFVTPVRPADVAAGGYPDYSGPLVLPIKLPVQQHTES